jgi:hypothetical protein
MTTDELERDLELLAEPHADDDAMRLAVRATLGRQLQPDRTIHRRSRLVFGSAAVATAALAAAIVALIGLGGSGGPSPANAAILAHIVRASSPPANVVVHVKETGTQAGGTQVDAEWWQETNPPYAYRLIKGHAASQIDGGSDGTTYSQYDAATDTIYQQPDSAPPTLIVPIESLRTGLFDGTASIAGTVTIDGRALYAVDLPGGVVGYFDKGDYRPAYIDNPQRGGSVVRTQVVAYDEFPLTAANEKLVSVAAGHPGARFATGEPPAPTKQPGEPK